MARYFAAFYKASGVDAFEYQYGSVYHTPSAVEAMLWRQNLSYYMSQGYTFQIRELTWQEREAWRFNEEYYPQLPWANDRVWCSLRHGHLHYAHVSIDDPTMLAFTASPEHGEQDRQTRMRPGKYLKKYFGDRLDDKKIAFLAEWFQTGQRPVAPVDATLQLAHTPDEIAEVYVKCVATSCMDGRHFDEVDTHPARVYGAGDLAVAYLRHASGTVIARALCWPEKKVLGRVYPTPDNQDSSRYDELGLTGQQVYDNLMRTMRSQGYTHYSEGVTFDNARLLKIDSGPNYLMPYLDGDYGVDDGGDYWLMRKRGAEYDCSNTGGYLDETEGSLCDSCEDRYNEDDMRCVVASVSSQGLARNTAYYCESCRDANTFYCEGINEDVIDNIEYVDVNGCCYNVNWFDNNGGYRCERTEEFYFEEDDPSVEVGDERWSPDAVKTDAFWCAHDGLYYPIEDLSETWPGFPSCLDDNEHITLKERIHHHPMWADNHGEVITDYEKSIRAKDNSLVEHMYLRLLGDVVENEEPEDDQPVLSPAGGITDADERDPASPAEQMAVYNHVTDRSMIEMINGDFACPTMRELEALTRPNISDYRVAHPQIAALWTPEGS